MRKGLKKISTKWLNLLVGLIGPATIGRKVRSEQLDILRCGVSLFSFVSFSIVSVIFLHL